MSPRFLWFLIVIFSLPLFASRASAVEDDSTGGLAMPSGAIVMEPGVGPSKAVPPQGLVCLPVLVQSPRTAPPQGQVSFDVLDDEDASGDEQPSRVCMDTFKKIAPSLRNICSDVCTLVGAGAFIVTFAAGLPELAWLAPAAFAANYTLDMFKRCKCKWAKLTQGASGEQIMQTVDSSGHLVAVAGLTWLAVDPASIPAAWLATGAICAKSAVVAASVYTQGLRATYGNDNDAMNLYGNLMCNAGGGAVGGILLAVGSSWQRLAYLLPIGAYVIGGAAAIGGVDALRCDIRQLQRRLK